MELVYFWVEENDSIKGTDFNFGSKYIFSFKKDDNENKGILSIKNNPNFIENFYTEKISISAIVGKNGTGKSQLLRLIWNGDIEKKQYFAILRNRDSKLIGIKDEKIEIDTELDIEWNNEVNTLTSLFYTNEGICENMMFNHKSITKNIKFLSKECSLKKIIDLEINTSRKQIQKQLNKFGVDTIKDIKSNLDTLLDDVEEKANEIINDEDNIEDFSRYNIDEQPIIDAIDNIEYALSDIELNLNQLINYEKIKMLLNSEQFEKILNILYDDSLKDIKDMQKPKEVEFKIDENKWKNEIDKHFNQTNNLYKKLSISDKIFLYYTYSWKSYIEKDNNVPEQIKKTYLTIFENYKKNRKGGLFSDKDIMKDKEDFFKEMVAKYPFFKKEQTTTTSFSIAKQYFEFLHSLYIELKKINSNINNIELNEDNRSLITNISKKHTALIKEGVNIDSVLNVNLLPKMSSGNLIILQTFAMLYDKINDIQDNNILLLLDEVEVYLHPNWQKQFLKLLIDFLSSKYENKNFHIILATHSPFLLSDIPKSNVVFLSDDEEIKIERTFGANIHTLLSDSFFMTDGLMGEFAKDKIQKIMNFLNSKDEIEKFHLSQQQIKLIIENIGEDLLRIKLLDMYYDKFEENELEKEKQQLLKKKEEIKELIKSIEEKQKQ